MVEEALQTALEIIKKDKEWNNKAANHLVLSIFK
jgi:hypothetical protein